MKRIYLIALISALVAGIATYMFAQSVISNNDPNKDKTEIVYAIADVPAGTQVTANNVNNFFSTRMIDNGAIVDGAVRSLDEVIGNTSSGYIYAGEQVSMKRFGTEQESNAGLSYNLADGMVAYSMAADGVTGVDGYILPGDTVNVLAMKTGDGKATVDTVLSDVKVLKISTNDVNTDTANAIVTYSSITFELSYDDADILYGVENSEKGARLFSMLLAVCLMIAALPLSVSAAGEYVPGNPRWSGYQNQVQWDRPAGAASGDSFEYEAQLLLGDDVVESKAVEIDTYLFFTNDVVTRPQEEYTIRVRARWIMIVGDPDGQYK